MVNVLHVQSRWAGRSEESLGHPGQRQMAPLHEKPQASHPPGVLSRATCWMLQDGHSVYPTVTVAWCPQTVAAVKNLISPPRFLCLHKLRSQASAVGFDFASSL